MNDGQGAETQLRQEMAGLAVDDILALCYAFQHRTERLILYLDVLRGRGGERAQFASCLICYDLARQGEATFQREFFYLADTVRELADKQDIIETMIGGDQYLSFIWELSQAAIEEMDPRFEAAAIDTTRKEEVHTLDLLSDDDFEELGGDFSVSVDEDMLWQRFDDAVEAFLGGVVGVPVYDPSAGFRLRDGHDVERIEAFLMELDSLRDLVPLARGYRALTLLFYGTHMRSRSFFGAVNERKQLLLRQGLEEFLASGPQVWDVVSVLGPMHSDPDTWDKISEALEDYTQWTLCSADAARGLDGYDGVNRLLARPPRRGERRRGER